MVRGTIDEALDAFDVRRAQNHRFSERPPVTTSTTKKAAPKSKATKAKASGTEEEQESTTARRTTRRTTAAKKSTTASKKKSAMQQPTVADAVQQVVEVEVKRDGDDVVLTVGGKKRNLDDVDDSNFDSVEAAKDEAEINAEEQAFDVSDSDDSDEPEQQVVSAGATADPVKDYLKQIGKVALLNAEQEVSLAKRIEAGLFAEEQMTLNNVADTDPGASDDPSYRVGVDNIVLATLLGGAQINRGSQLPHLRRVEKCHLPPSVIPQLPPRACSALALSW